MLDHLVFTGCLGAVLVAWLLVLSIILLAIFYPLALAALAAILFAVYLRRRRPASLRR